MIDQATYETALRSHLAECRKLNPILDRQALSVLDESQCRVLGGHLIHWLSDAGPRLLQERAALSRLQGWNPNPLICLRLPIPGLVAAQEILGTEPALAVWGIPADFASFMLDDSSYDLHVELHSAFETVTVADLDPSARRRHPLTGSETYLFHVEESIMGPLFARGARHLWKWDGAELELLEEGIETWVS